MAPGWTAMLGEERGGGWRHVREAETDHQRGLIDDLVHDVMRLVHNGMAEAMFSAARMEMARIREPYTWAELDTMLAKLDAVQLLKAELVEEEDMGWGTPRSEDGYVRVGLDKVRELGEQKRRQQERKRGR